VNKKTREEAIMSAKRYLSAAALALASGLVCTTANAAGIFTLQSNTFKDGQLMPKKVANSHANAPNNPNCVGENVSPELHWTNVPDGTKSFALLITDPDARNGAGVMQTVLYGIPASITALAEGELSKASEKFVGGRNSGGVGIYAGPCTPPGTAAHHYTFILIATDFEPKELPPGLTHDEVVEKIAPGGKAPVHAKAAAGLVGLFVNPYPQ
jgi:Raf kinase inhibitor-like YbhB/YbcL family protein